MFNSVCFVMLFGFPFLAVVVCDQYNCYSYDEIFVFSISEMRFYTFFQQKLHFLSRAMICVLRFQNQIPRFQNFYKDSRGHQKKASPPPFSAFPPLGKMRHWGGACLQNFCKSGRLDSRIRITRSKDSRYGWVKDVWN